jgi:hypothetical protein
VIRTKLLVYKVALSGGGGGVGECASKSKIRITFKPCGQGQPRLTSISQGRLQRLVIPLLSLLGHRQLDHDAILEAISTIGENIHLKVCINRVKVKTNLDYFVLLFESEGSIFIPTSENYLSMIDWGVHFYLEYTSTGIQY